MHIQSDLQFRILEHSWHLSIFLRLDFFFNENWLRIFSLIAFSTSFPIQEEKKYKENSPFRCPQFQQTISYLNLSSSTNYIIFKIANKPKTRKQASKQEQWKPFCRWWMCSGIHGSDPGWPFAYSIICFLVFLKRESYIFLFGERENQCSHGYKKTSLYQI